MPHMPLVEPPPRNSRFGSALKLSKVRWVRAELVVKVAYLAWTEDSLLRQVSYQGQREDIVDASRVTASTRELGDLLHVALRRIGSAAVWGAAPRRQFDGTSD